MKKAKKPFKVLILSAKAMQHPVQTSEA